MTSFHKLGFNLGYQQKLLSEGKQKSNVQSSSASAEEPPDLEPLLCVPLKLASVSATLCEALRFKSLISLSDWCHSFSASILESEWKKKGFSEYLVSEMRGLNVCFHTWGRKTTSLPGPGSEAGNATLARLLLSSPLLPLTLFLPLKPPPPQHCSPRSRSQGSGWEEGNRTPPPPASE